MKCAALIVSAILIAGCVPNATSVESALQPQTSSSDINPNALISEGPAQGETIVSNPAANQQNPSVATLGTQSSVAFVQMEGMPQTATTFLTQSLRTSVEKQGLIMANAGQPVAEFRIRGYFSALNDGSGTLLVYVWDIFDLSGKRIHRINGQERSEKTSINPWQSIASGELSRVADRTAAQLSSWVGARKS